MRLLELIEGQDGKLDEQSLLSIILVLTFCVLSGHAQWTNTPFNAEGFGIGGGAVMGATLGGMAYRAAKQGRNNDDSNSQPSGN